MNIGILEPIDPTSAKEVLTNKRGIYFWNEKQSNDIVYIGIALGNGGLRRRICLQHLNEKYLEYRPHKQSAKHSFQLSHAITQVSKSTGKEKKGIDKSAFRKAIGRLQKLKPGSETVEYILRNLVLRVYESEDKEYIKELEKDLIKQYKPIFNSSHKGMETQQADGGNG